MHDHKQAPPGHPIHELIAKRWSPHAFADRPVSDLEATARGLFVHQMIGILPEKVRELYHVPDGVQPLTGLAVGYVADAHILPEVYRQRDLAPRQRKPLREFVFGGRWGAASPLVT